MKKIKPGQRRLSIVLSFVMGIIFAFIIFIIIGNKEGTIIGSFVGCETFACFLLFFRGKFEQNFKSIWLGIAIWFFFTPLIILLVFALSKEKQLTDVTFFILLFSMVCDIVFVMCDLMKEVSKEKESKQNPITEEESQPNEQPSAAKKLSIEEVRDLLRMSDMYAESKSVEQKKDNKDNSQ